MVEASTIYTTPPLDPTGDSTIHTTAPFPDPTGDSTVYTTSPPLDSTDDPTIHTTAPPPDPTDDPTDETTVGGVELVLEDGQQHSVAAIPSFASINKHAEGAHGDGDSQDSGPSSQIVFPSSFDHLDDSYGSHDDSDGTDDIPINKTLNSYVLAARVIGANEARLESGTSGNELTLAYNYYFDK